ncbi:hypothetical protein E2542_SST21790 [Spatholobus suberectus]|nr:hypothetical protein E2542_SST21790 [Spatholobus suberectus]
MRRALLRERIRTIVEGHELQHGNYRGQLLAEGREGAEDGEGLGPDDAPYKTTFHGECKNVVIRTRIVYTRIGNLCRLFRITLQQNEMLILTSSRDSDLGVRTL